MFAYRPKVQFFMLQISGIKHVACKPNVLILVFGKRRHICAFYMALEHEKTIPKNIYFLDLFMDLWLKTTIRKGRFFLKGLASIKKIY